MLIESRNAGGVLAAGAALVLVAGALLPPFVDGAARLVVQQAFAPVCHQLPARSFAIGGVPLAVGHRCFGIYAGLAAGALLWMLAAVGVKREVGRRAGRLLVVAGAPAAADWALGALGWWANTPGSRATTGALLGAAMGLLLARAAGQALARRSGAAEARAEHA